MVCVGWFEFDGAGANNQEHFMHPPGVDSRPQSVRQACSKKGKDAKTHTPKTLTISRPSFAHPDPKAFKPYELKRK